jgi:hypothetical protein
MRLHFLSLLIRLSVYQTQASSLGILITFVNNLVISFKIITRTFAASLTRYKKVSQQNFLGHPFKNFSLLLK